MTNAAMELKEGDPAPAFELKDDAGTNVRLSDFKGKTVVLYFYPKDDTPGCTKEACSFRDLGAEFKKRGAAVLGASPDDADSHQAFKAKFKLSFPLLADEGHKAAEAYGAWGEKTLYGRTFEGLIRSTFVIGPDGRLVKIYRNVKVDGHVEKVLESLG